MRMRFTLAVLALVTAVAAPARPDSVPAADVRQNLYASCFVDAKEGWIVGDLGRVFHTVDGGLNWEIQATGTKRPFAGIACTDRSNLWIAGQGGQIAHSTNGGKSWETQKSGSERQLLNIAFSNAKRGLAIGDFGTLLRTEDGGATWSKAAIPADLKLPPDIAEVVQPGDVVLYGLSFADADHVWVAGEFGVIMASTDGGATWQGQTSGVETTLFGIRFADQQKGWAVGIDETLLHTVDGGATWQRQRVQTPKEYSLAFYDVDIKGAYAWVVGSSGLLLSSKDAGETWQLPPVPVQMRSVWFRGVTMFPEGRGLVVGSGGMMLTLDRDSFATSKKQF